MTRSRENFQLDIYGDNFLRQLCPSIRNCLRIDVIDQVTLRGGTIRLLRRKVSRIYRRRKSKKINRDRWAMLMIGIHDVMSYSRQNIWKFSVRLRKDLSVLIALLEYYHKHILLLTAPPILKMQGRSQYWYLLRKYNKFIKRYAENPNMKVVDLFPIFVRRDISDACNVHLYEQPRSSRKRRLQVWNEAGMERVIRKISDAGQENGVFLPPLFTFPKDSEDSVTDSITNLDRMCKAFGVAELSRIKTISSIGRLQHRKSSTHDSEKGEKCSYKSSVGTREDDFCAKRQRQECSSVNYFTHRRVRERSRSLNRHYELGERRYSKNLTKMVEHTGSIYNARTVYLLESMKRKLSWIRTKEYSSYGAELVKTNKINSIENELLTVATYNVLSQELLEKHRYIYAKHDSRCLNWNLRREILAEEFVLLDADILCLQEVDFLSMDPVYNDCLSGKGYEGVYKKKTGGKNDGCAIYFKRDKFNLVESKKVELFKTSVTLLHKDNIGVILKLSLKNRPETEIIVATTHLLYNPKRADIKLVQTQIMLAEIERLAYKGRSPETGEPEYIPVIFTGDMNYDPESAVYEFVTKSYFEYEGKPHKYLLPYTEGQILKKTLLPAALGITDSCQYLSSICNREGKKNVSFETGSLTHPLNLSSVYNHFKQSYPEATTNQERWITVDYIFYSRVIDRLRNCRTDGELKLVSKLTLPNCREAELDLIAIPNLACGSDHLPLLATFHMSGYK